MDDTRTKMRKGRILLGSLLIVAGIVIAAVMIAITTNSNVRSWAQNIAGISEETTNESQDSTSNSIASYDEMIQEHIERSQERLEEHISRSGERFDDFAGKD